MKFHKFNVQWSCIGFFVFVLLRGSVELYKVKEERFGSFPEPGESAEAEGWCVTGDLEELCPPSRQSFLL